VVIGWLWRPLVWGPRNHWALLVRILGLRRTLRLIWPVRLRWRTSLLRPSALRRHLLTLLLLSAKPLIIVPLCCGPLLLRNSGTRLGTRHVLLRPLALHVSRLIIAVSLIPRLRWTRCSLTLFTWRLCRPSFVVAVVPWLRRTRDSFPFLAWRLYWSSLIALLLRRPGYRLTIFGPRRLRLSRRRRLYWAGCGSRHFCALILRRFLRASGLRTLRLRWLFGPLLSRPRRLRASVFGLRVSLLGLRPLVLLWRLICILLRRLPLLLCSRTARSG
jgi:hypothetical protein